MRFVCTSDARAEMTRCFTSPCNTEQILAQADMMVRERQHFCRLCTLEVSGDMTSGYCSSRCEDFGQRVNVLTPANEPGSPRAMDDIVSHCDALLKACASQPKNEFLFELYRDAMYQWLPCMFLSSRRTDGNVDVISAVSMDPHSCNLPAYPNVPQQEDASDPMAGYLWSLHKPVLPHPSDWFSLLEKSDGEVASHLVQRRATGSEPIPFPWSLCDHSCTPTIGSNGKAAFTPIKQCIPGKALSISRLHGIELRMCTSLRRTFLSLRCGIQQCRCDRCSDAFDFARGIKCSCTGGIRLRRQSFACQAEPWECAKCGERWGDDELPTAVEDKLSERIHRLFMQLTDMVQNRSPLDRRTFAELKQLTQQCHEVLGDGHWCSLVLAECAILFFRTFQSQKFSAVTVCMAQQQILSWGKRWLQLARLQRFSEYCPEEAIRCARTVFEEVSEPRFFSERKHFDGARCLESFAQSQQLESSMELLEQWEQYLVSRVSNSLQSDPEGNDLLKRIVTSSVHS